MDLDQYHMLLAADDKARATGAWSGAPSLAASDTPMTNTSGKPVYFSCSGGTVTAIKVDGVAQAGLVSGRFRIKRGGTVSVTYSVAPTAVAWTFE